MKDKEKLKIIATTKDEKYTGTHKVKSKMIEDAITIKEHRSELQQIKNSKKIKAKKGRKSDLQIMKESGEDKIIATKIYSLSAKGYTRKKIRSELNLPLSTWDNMMRKRCDTYPIYKQARDRGELYAVEEVENALKNKAMGYEYKEITVSEKDGYKEVTKHFPPDTKAIQFFLSNKKPAEYKMKQPEVLNVNIKKETIDYTKLAPDVLDALLEASNNNNNVVATIPQVKESDNNGNS